jgi:hypothetical protein
MPPVNTQVNVWVGGKSFDYSHSRNEINARNKNYLGMMGRYTVLCLNHVSIQALLDIELSGKWFLFIHSLQKCSSHT